MKQQFLQGKTGTIRVTVYQNNRPIIPTSAKITLYKAGSTGVLQAQATAAVNSTTGEMTYSLTATHTADNDMNYKAIWEYVYDGTTYYETQLFDVVKSILSIPITDDDIFDELESLRKQNVQVTGTATAGAAGSITDTKRKESDDYWKGGIVEIMSGTGNGQKRDVTGFTQSTGALTVTPNWTTNPDTTSIYRLVKSYTRKIEQAFTEIEAMLYNKGKRDCLILEASQIKFPLLYLTIHKICTDLMDEENDKWDILAKSYWDKFNNHFTTMKLDYDEDESGAVSGQDEEGQSVSEIRLFRG